MPDTLQPLISGTFLRLADALESQPSDAWDLPSLCEAWQVREVVAHVSTAARYTPEAFFAEIGADGGDLSRTTDRIAARDGQLEPSTLLAGLRDERLHRWLPPGGGEPGALVHVVVHGLDVTHPLGIDSWLPDGALHAALGAVTGSGLPAHFGVDTDGIEFSATDLDWTWGQGRPVRGVASDLVLALCGRRLAPGRFTGAFDQASASTATVAGSHPGGAKT